jgi:hypothetical protein
MDQYHAHELSEQQTTGNHKRTQPVDHREPLEDQTSRPQGTQYRTRGAHRADSIAQSASRDELDLDRRTTEDQYRRHRAQRAERATLDAIELCDISYVTCVMSDSLT